MKWKRVPYYSNNRGNIDVCKKYVKTFWNLCDGVKESDKIWPSVGIKWKIWAYLNSYPSSANRTTGFVHAMRPSFLCKSVGKSVALTVHQIIMSDFEMTDRNGKRRDDDNELISFGMHV